MKLAAIAIVLALFFSFQPACPEKRRSPFWAANIKSAIVRFIEEQSVSC
jgi:hypothetical protein